MRIFSKQESLDTLISNAVFAVGILCNSKAVAAAKAHDKIYLDAATKELETLEKKLIASALPTSLKLVLVYVPLLSKDGFVEAFDKRLKGLQ